MVNIDTIKRGVIKQFGMLNKFCSLIFFFFVVAALISSTSAESHHRKFIQTPLVSGIFSGSTRKTKRLRMMKMSKKKRKNSETMNIEWV